MDGFDKYLGIGDQGDRVYGLDIVRAAAIFFVVLLHSIYLLPPHMAAILEYFIIDGVSVFFVLSGFLIGSILINTLETGPADFKALLIFWARRWLRTLPAYYFVLILLLLIPSIFTHFAGWHEALRYFFFLQNINTIHPLFFADAWSLSIEEWFYLCIPAMVFLCVAMLRLPARNSILSVAVVVILLSISHRFYVFSNLTINSMNDWDGLLRKQVLTRMDSIMAGVLGAWAAFYHRDLWCRYKVPMLVIGILIVIGMKGVVEMRSASMKFFLCVPYFTINAIGALFVLPYLSEWKRSKGLVYRAVTLISIISYSMYLLNFSVVQGYLLRKINFHDGSVIYLAWRYFLFWVLTVAGALLLYIFIERPFMRLRQRK